MFLTCPKLRFSGGLSPLGKAQSWPQEGSRIHHLMPLLSERELDDPRFLPLEHDGTQLMEVSP